MSYAAERLKRCLERYYNEMTVAILEAKDRERVENSFFYVRDWLDSFRSMLGNLDEVPDFIPWPLSVAARKAIEMKWAMRVKKVSVREELVCIGDISEADIGEVPVDDLREATVAILRTFVSIVERFLDCFNVSAQEEEQIVKSEAEQEAENRRNRRLRLALQDYQKVTSEIELEYRTELAHLGQKPTEAIEGRAEV